MLHNTSVFNPCFNLFRKFGYVEFSSEEDMQKAMELNGKKVMGQELKMDRARSKDSAQDGKKGNTKLKLGFSQAVNLRNVYIYTLHFLAHTWLSSTRV